MDNYDRTAPVVLCNLILNPEYGGLVLFGRAGRIRSIETLKASHPLIYRCIAGATAKVCRVLQEERSERVFFYGS